ncbi:hypothetical protein [Pseudomonas mandelii]|uniref:hypothetical protein n=1 Tax=Pseudomonas mandelii TaxID=75612 RepID=UPI003C753DFE
MGITIDGSGVATLALMGLKDDGTEYPLVSFIWSHPSTASAQGELNVYMNGAYSALRIAPDGSIGMPSMKTAATVGGSPAGTLYRDASNFVKIV